MLTHAHGTLDADVDADADVGDGPVCRYAAPKSSCRSMAGGKDDTPASLITRACDAFGPRRALGVPDFDTLPPQTKLPPSPSQPTGSDDGDSCSGGAVLARVTDRTILPAAAAIALEPADGFLWLHYSGLGVLVDRIARGLVELGLAAGSYVAISGYNDFEWAAADFAVARVRVARPHPPTHHLVDLGFPFASAHWTSCVTANVI